MHIIDYLGTYCNMCYIYDVHVCVLHIVTCDTGNKVNTLSFRVE